MTPSFNQNVKYELYIFASSLYHPLSHKNKRKKEVNHTFYHPHLSFLIEITPACQNMEFNKDEKSLFAVGIAAVFWTIWKLRNGVVFD